MGCNQTGFARILANQWNRTLLKEILQAKESVHNMASALQAFGHLHREVVLT